MSLEEKKQKMRAYASRFLARSGCSLSLDQLLQDTAALAKEYVRLGSPEMSLDAVDDDLFYRPDRTQLSFTADTDPSQTVSLVANDICIFDLEDSATKVLKFVACICSLSMGIV